MVVCAGTTDDRAADEAMELRAAAPAGRNRLRGEDLRVPVEVEPVVVVDEAVPVVILAVAGDLPRVAVHVACRVGGEDEVVVVDDVQRALAGHA